MRASSACEAGGDTGAARAAAGVRRRGLRGGALRTAVFSIRERARSDEEWHEVSPGRWKVEAQGVVVMQAMKVERRTPHKSIDLKADGWKARKHLRSTNGSGAETSSNSAGRSGLRGLQLFRSPLKTGPRGFPPQLHSIRYPIRQPLAPARIWRLGMALSYSPANRRIVIYMAAPNNLMTNGIIQYNIDGQLDGKRKRTREHSD